MKPGPKFFLLIAAIVSALISLSAPHLSPYFLHIVIGIGINIILAVSLNLVNGYAGQFSLGHAGFMAVGAYTAAWFTVILGPRLVTLVGGANNPVSASVLFVIALAVGGILAAAAGLAVGVPSLRLKGDYLAIVTLGFGEIIRVILQNMDAVGGARGFTVPPYTNFFWTFALAGLTIYVVTTMVHSTLGRGFVAVHDDEIAAEAIGINTTRYKVIAFVVGAFFAGIAGGLYAHQVQFISPDGFNFVKSIEIVVMVILGGMGNTVGVIIAAVLLSLLPALLREAPPIAVDFLVAGSQVKFTLVLKDYIMIFYSLLIIVLMLTRPQGLFTLRRAART
ncbi:MAG: branched-chain amino acid ABC transporter permease [Verrucomicrobia bacterium]|nr:branched-chain amino acid ABC transporter permease [Verrucomicrobiota bacterium]